MASISSKLFPLIAMIAVVLALSAWATAGAAGPAAQTVIHFSAVATSQHFSSNGATKKNPAGASFQENVKLVAGGKQIGWAWIDVTEIGRGGNSIAQITADIYGKGRVDLMGAWPAKGDNRSIIVGGTGAFSGVTGEADGHNQKVVLTYS